MLKILFIPGFIYKDSDFEFLKEFNATFLEGDKISIEAIESHDIVIAHSLGCLELSIFIMENNLTEKLNEKVVHYNPIVECNLLNITIKRFLSRKIFFTVKGLKLVLRFWIHFFTNFPYIYKSIRKITSRRTRDLVKIYSEFNNVYLSKRDVFSKKYFHKLSNAKDIDGEHD